MEQPEEIKFSINEKYENEKGFFRVISIHRDKMVIRWENGDEIRTDIGLQKRIAERRRREAVIRQEEADSPKVAPQANKPNGRKTGFSGFVSKDFKNSATGTTWRARHNLGSMITQKLESSDLEVQSWAFRNKPEMHFQDINHHRRPAPENRAKLFIMLDTNSLRYGFQISRTAKHEGKTADWKAFYNWLVQPESEKMLRTIVAENNLAICNRNRPKRGVLLVPGKGWRSDVDGKVHDWDTLSEYIDKMPEIEPFELEIAVRIEKADAVASGRKVISIISRVFSSLMPLYRAAAS
jgi:hypothetical protein